MQIPNLKSETISVQNPELRLTKSFCPIAMTQTQMTKNKAKTHMKAEAQGTE
jgi:hypothetical protein